MIYVWQLHTRRDTATHLVGGDAGFRSVIEEVTRVFNSTAKRGEPTARPMLSVATLHPEERRGRNPTPPTDWVDIVVCIASHCSKRRLSDPLWVETIRRARAYAERLAVRL